MKFKLPSSLSFVDVETTGGNPRGDRIIEIGIIRVEGGEIVDTLNTLINPEDRVPPEITRITGITQQEVDTAPVFGSVRDTVIELLADSVFVAHNARFDYGFVKNELMRLENRFSAKVLCTVRLARQLYPTLPRYNLDTIISSFGFACEKRHRAYDDAHVLWEFYKRSFDSLPEDHFVSAVHSILKTPSLPINLKHEDLDALPESPGVYLFYGDGDLPLYIGKSIDLRDRVKSHFATDYQSATDMKISREIKRIEIIETAGELGASIRESHLIKQKKPIYNKMLRDALDVVAAVKYTRSDSFESINLIPAHELETQDIENVLGVFRSKRQAKEVLYEIAKVHNLCPKLLGLESGKGKCFYSQLGYCRGGCIGKEDPLFYNLRFLGAFIKTKVTRWPHEGPILIPEEHEGKREIHIVDQWCYLGSYEGNSQEAAFEIKNREIRFDWDLYRIISRHLTKPYVQRSLMKEKESFNLLPDLFLEPI